jgi:hypothetical protein
MNEDPKANTNEGKAQGVASTNASVAQASAGKDTSRRKGGEKERPKAERQTRSANAGRRK